MSRLSVPRVASVAGSGTKGSAGVDVPPVAERDDDRQEDVVGDASRASPAPGPQQGAAQWDTGSLPAEITL